MNCSSDIQLEGCEEEKLDRSLQGPLSLLFLFSALWLVVSSLLGAVAFWQLKFPGFIDFQSGIETPYIGWFFDFHTILDFTIIGGFIKALGILIDFSDLILISNVMNLLIQIYVFFFIKLIFLIFKNLTLMI